MIFILIMIGKMMELSEYMTASSIETIIIKCYIISSQR